MERDTCVECGAYVDHCRCWGEPEACWQCLGVGGYHDCGEDTCCCLHPDDETSDDWYDCEECGGKGFL